MNIAGIDLVTATAQPITVLKQTQDAQPLYVFLKPEGMCSRFYFEENAITDQGNSLLGQRIV